MWVWGVGCGVWLYPRGPAHGNMYIVQQTMCLDLVSGLTSEQCLHASVRFSRGMIRWQSVGPLKNIEGRSQMVILCKNQDDTIVIYINLHVSVVSQS